MIVMMQLRNGSHGPLSLSLCVCVCVCVWGALHLALTCTLRALS